ncbi:MAG TPA: hypothetical protein VGJ36_03865 [Gemmatimonadales bacterium]|jgi:hypothetical protein
MASFRVYLSAAGLLLLACGSESRTPEPPALDKAFSSLPLPPDPEFVSRAGSADALQITLHSSADVARVIDYYRNVLSRGSWRLVSDLKSADGSTALYAEQNGPPLWVRIWKATDRSGTMVQLTGAVVIPDSVKSQPKPDTTSKRTGPRQS